MPRAVDGVSQAEVDRLNARVLADPDIQRVLQAEKARLQQTHDQGGSAREYQQGIAQLVTHLAQEKGLLPSKGNYFVNPNDGQLEPHRGWSGLAGWQKALVIGGVAAATLATAGAFGVGPASALFGGGGGSAAGGGTAAATGAAFDVAPNIATLGGAAAAHAVAPAVAGAASSGLAHGLMAYGIPAATGVVGNVLQSRAENNATELQNDYLNRALDEERENKTYGRQQYADYLGRLKPYGDAGNAAVGRLSALTQRDPQAPTGGAMVRLKAPDGSMRDVPAEYADHYLQQGAVRI